MTQAERDNLLRAVCCGHHGGCILEPESKCIALEEPHKAHLDKMVDAVLAALPALQHEEWNGWLPTSDAINALPDPLRRYIAALETECDPSGTIRENFRLREENAGLRRECAMLAASPSPAQGRVDPKTIPATGPRCPTCDWPGYDDLRKEVESLARMLKSISAQCGNVIFNCEQRPADNERHLASWRGVKEFADAAMVADKERGEVMSCEDCNRQYGDEHGFPDLIIPYWAWKQISPTGDDGGLLCPSCICKRLHAKGIRCEGAFMSGPIAPVSRPMMNTMRRLENIELAIEGRDNAWKGVRDLLADASLSSQEREP